MTAIASLELADESRRRVGQGYWGGVVRRLAHDPVALAAAVVIVGIVLAAIFAPWLAPADPYRSSMLRGCDPSAMQPFRSAPTNSAATC
jgi:peptide/nickel transport system permease protein